MKLTGVVAALLAVPAALAATVTVSFDQAYDNGGSSLATVSCSDGVVVSALLFLRETSAYMVSSTALALAASPSLFKASLWINTGIEGAASAGCLVGMD